MNTHQKPSRYVTLFKSLEKVAAWAAYGARIAIMLGMLLTALTPSSVALAQDGGPDDPASGAAGKMLQIFISLAKLFINIAYALMFIVFAVGSVKSGLGAQAAQQFGATGKVSYELLNLAGGVVIFVFGLMTLPLVNMIISAVSEQFTAGGGWDFNIEMPVPIPGDGG